MLTTGFCPSTTVVPLLIMLAMQFVSLEPPDDKHYSIHY
nr:Hypothetical protein LRH_00022 [Lacticaseibacillus rhamnosus HN001]